MVSISSNMNTALLLLRQDSFARNSPAMGAADQMPTFVNGNIISSGSVQEVFAAEVDIASEEGEIELEDPYRPKNDILDALENFDVTMADGSSLQLKLNRPESFDIFGSDYGAVRSMISTAKSERKPDFKSALAIATILPPSATDKWKQALQSAQNETSELVGNVINANAGFHLLKEIAPPDGKPFDFLTEQVNSGIKSRNFMAIQNVTHAKWVVSDALSKPGLGEHIKLDDNGEYKISAYQITTDDGKLVAEMKDNGHFITYNEDGTVLRERNRSDVCADLSRTNGRNDTFGRMAALLSNDDKDLQLY